MYLQEQPDPEPEALLLNPLTEVHLRLCIISGRLYR